MITDSNWRLWMQTGQITLRIPVRSVKNLTNALLLDVKWVFWSPFQASNMPVHCFSGSLAFIGHWYCIIYTVFIVGFSEVFVSDWLKNVLEGWEFWLVLGYIKLIKTKRSAQRYRKMLKYNILKINVCVILYQPLVYG